MSEMAQTDIVRRASASRIANLLKGLGQMVLWIVLLFVSAGTIRSTRGWICAGVYFITMTITGMLVHHFNHDLMQARSKFARADTASFDKLFLILFVPLTFVQVIVAGLDAVRFGWSHMPLWTVYPGILIYLFGIALVAWTLSVNPHAEQSVRIQSDRGHAVVTCRPYRFVRHPMYVGSMLMYPATALMLGSRWALVIAALMIILLIIRTSLEDKMLRNKLAGYDKFASETTRCRLVPGIW
ncbi:MAG TPA: isoprenylcysteine carboxylmethyltransferase family protein [Terriglobales bacterium]|nr:isoprenylcysteine carboxylmethyltransferase family protein [Terriglobales bacterium]